MNRLARATAHAEKIMAYAEAHYDAGGWDVIVECWEISAIAENLIESGITNYRDAFAAFSFTADVWADRQADARNSAF